MNIELLLVNKVNVYEYSTSSSGVNGIGGLIRVDALQEYSLDLFEDETIPITYEINDAIDPSKKTSPFSKSFLIPGTKRNSLAFGFPYMVSNASPFRKLRGKVVGLEEWHLPVTDARIYVDGILVFSGKVDLTKATMDEGEIHSFEINFLATSINIFDELEAKLMTDLILPTPLLDTEERVRPLFFPTNSDEEFTSGSTTYNGFTLAYPDWGFKEYTDSDTATSPNITSTTGSTSMWRTNSQAPNNQSECGLKLCYNYTQYAFVKYLIDKIFDVLDFTYSSTLFNSQEFKSLLLLYYNSKELPSNTSIKLFGSAPASGGYFDDIVTSFVPISTSRILKALDSEGTIPSGSPFNANEQLQDPFTIFDVGSQKLTFRRGGNYNIRFKALLDIRYGWDQQANGNGAFCPGGIPNANVYPHATHPLVGPQSKIILVRNGVDYLSADISSAIRTSESLASPSTYNKLGTNHFQWEASFDIWSTDEFILFGLLVQPGDEIQFKILLDTSGYEDAQYAFGCTPLPQQEKKYQFAIDYGVIDVSPVYHNWSQTLPNVTQKEFLTSIIKHFNVYTELTQNSRDIAFESRDEFYKGSTIRDWTRKIDLSSVRSIEGGEPPKTIITRMKKTGNVDDLASQRANMDELEYGSFRQLLENGDSETLEIKSQFASLTPDLSTSGPLSNVRVVTEQTIGGNDLSWNVPNPALFSRNDSGEREIKEESEMYLAYKNSNVRTFHATLGQDMFAWYAIPGDPGTVEYVRNDADESIGSHIWGISSFEAPGVDINFRATRQNMFGSSDTPPVFSDLDSAYERYFSSFYQNLDSQRIFKAKVKLNAADIAQFSFRDPVFIDLPSGDSSYFIVDSIDYDPTSPGPYDVTLLTFNKEFYDFNFNQVGVEFPDGPDSPIGTG